MKESIHYLLMSDHFLFQKSLVNAVKDTGLTSGQPKILDYLKDHDGSVQKDIAAGCHIEPASLTVILNGMESKGYIERRMQPGDRRSVSVFLTEKGRKYVERLNQEFERIEETALHDFEEAERQRLQEYLTRVYKNMIYKGKEEK